MNRRWILGPVLSALFALPGVARVFLGGDFISVTKTDEVSWQTLKPHVSQLDQLVGFEPARLLQPQHLLILQRAHRRRLPEMAVEGGGAHAGQPGERLDAHRLVVVLLQILHGLDESMRKNLALI